MKINNRITPENIIKLEKNEVFVYGSNQAGIHGAGAAKQALKWGAKIGYYGFEGQTYGINTKDIDIKTLTLRDIQFYINQFITFAENRPHLKFLVTKIGCGLAGYGVEDIAPLFIKAKNISNIYLPQEFWNYIEPFYGDGY